MALSGDSNLTVQRPQLTVAVTPDGSLQLTSSASGTLESTTRLDLPGTVWNDEGPIAGTRTLVLAPNERAKFFRVRR